MCVLKVVENHDAWLSVLEVIKQNPVWYCGQCLKLIKRILLFVVHV